MAVTNLVRNLRDGELVITDGSAATLTLTLDNGDLSWTDTESAIEILDRGTLSHVRIGDENPSDVSFSAMWVHLVDETSGSGSATQLYELMRNLGSTYTSTRPSGEKYCVNLTFTVDDPSTATNTEAIAFEFFYVTSIECSEGDEANTISVTGRNFQTGPTITRT